MTAAAAVPVGGLLARTEEHVRTALFGGIRSPFWRVGAEIELIALDARDMKPVPVERVGDERALLPMLREAGAPHRWRETKNACGVPCFVIPGVGVLSFEPGGQVEISTRPFSFPSVLLRVVREVVGLLNSVGLERDVRFLQLGLDPVNEPEAVPLALAVPRYERMAAYFSRIGGDGLRMMKQTASCQVSLDVAPDDVADTWRVLNALVPVVIAAFANSPYSRGRRTAFGSTRARIWQNTDPRRTGIFMGDDAPGEYLAFALNASPFLLSRTPAVTIRAAAEAVAMTDGEWSEHLSTLFPEVRPRGYMEFRACDMVGDDARAALLVLLCAVTRGPRTRAEIREIVGGPDRREYSAAPAAPRHLLSLAADAGAAAMKSARAEPGGFWAADDLRRAERFFDDYTSAGRTPASDVLEPA